MTVSQRNGPDGTGRTAEPGAAGGTGRTADLGFARLDLDRAQRTGDPEVVFGAGKTPAQVVASLRALHRAHPGRAVLGTRLPGPGAVYRSQTLNFHAPVKIGDVVTVLVDVVELIPEGRRVRLKCEALVDGQLVLDGEAVVSVPPRPK